MKINQENYEQYFLDYAEGTLSPEMEKELFIFLEANPDLKTVLEDFDATPLPADEIKNSSLKKRLKKNIHPTLHIDEANIDEWLAKDLECLLSASEQTELEEFLRLNPAYGYDREIFAMTLMKADLKVVFPGKKALKRKVPVIVFTRGAWFVTAAAAVIMLILGISYVIRQEINDGRQVIPAEKQVVATEDRDIPAEADEIAVAPAKIPQGDDMKKGKANDPEKGMESLGTPSLADRTSPFRMEKSNALSIITVDKQDNIAANGPTLDLIPINIDPDKKEQPLLAKAFGKMVMKARNAVRRSPNLENIRNSEVDFWSIAEAGVKTFSTVTDRDLELLVRRDDDGNIKSYALVEEERLILTKSRAKN